jgi:hypothetical protein
VIPLWARLPGRAHGRGARAKSAARCRAGRHDEAENGETKHSTGVAPLAADLARLSEVKCAFPLSATTNIQTRSGVVEWHAALCSRQRSANRSFKPGNIVRGGECLPSGHSEKQQLPRFPISVHQSKAIHNPQENLMKRLAVALASTFLIGGAYAQSAATPVSAAPAANASPAAMAKSDARRDMKVEKYIKDLHAKLKITPAEEPQWATVAKTMQDSANDMDVAIDKRKSLMSSATAVDDLNAYGNIAQTHADTVKKLAAVFTPLYASMSDDQKKLADGVFMQRTPEGHRVPKAMK